MPKVIPGAREPAIQNARSTWPSITNFDNETIDDFKRTIDDNGTETEHTDIIEDKNNSTSTGFNIDGTGSFGGDNISGDFTLDMRFGNSTSENSHKRTVDGTVTEYNGTYTNSGSSSVGIDFDMTGSWNNTSYTMTAQSGSSKSHTRITTDTIDTRTIEYLKNRSSNTDVQMTITQSNGETYSVITSSSNSSSLRDPTLGGYAMFTQTIDAQGNPTGNIAIAGSYEQTDVSTYETQNTNPWEDSHYKSRDTTITTVTPNNTTVDSTHEILIDKYQGIHNEPYTYDWSDTYLTDPIQTNGVPVSFTSMPGLFDPFNSLRLAAGNRIAAEMNSQAAESCATFDFTHRRADSLLTRPVFDNKLP